MYRTTVIVIKNNLKEFVSFLSEIKEKAFFEIKLLTINEFIILNKNDVNDIFSPEDLIIFLDSEIDNKLMESMQKAYDHLFPEFKPVIATIVREPHERANNDDFYDSEHTFFFSRTVNEWYGALYFINFCNQIFLESGYHFHLYDYMSASVQEIIKSDTLIQQYQGIKELNIELERKNDTDPLTSLYNRRALSKILNNELHKEERLIKENDKISKKILSGLKHEDSWEKNSDRINNYLQKDSYSLSILLMDIDNFKKINDNFGHLVGDKVLQSIGTILCESGILRSSDIPARYGGDEFIVVLPGLNCRNAQIVAHRIKERIAKEVFFSEEKSSFHVSCSIGIAGRIRENTSLEDIINNADKALYWVKRNGRNKVKIFNDIVSEEE